MARLARLSVGGLPHLVLQRGAHGASLFRGDSDREHFLGILCQVCDETKLAVHAYSLLPDAVYVVATPPDAHATGRFVQAMGRRYVRWFNDRHGRHGALFDGRFRSSVIEADALLLSCLRFVESRPAAAGLVIEPSQYRWSSCRHHIGLATEPLVVDPARFWALGNTPFERQAAWREFMHTGASTAETIRIAEALLGGWALGSQKFLAELAQTAGRRAAPGQPGRPRNLLVKTDISTDDL
ncbi:MAG: transposase [Burkholderiaceae bacterium]